MNIADLVNTPKYRHWTQGAIECYQRGSTCQGCQTFEIIGKNCKMKYAVLKLVASLGAPEGVKIKHIIDDTKLEREKEMTNTNPMELTQCETEVLNLLLNGLNYSQISEKLSKALPTVKSYVNSIFRKKHVHSLQELLIKELTSNGPIVDNKQDEIELNTLKTENTQLKKRVQELEAQTRPVIDFTQIRDKIRREIDELSAKLKAIDIIEAEIA